MGAPRVLAHIWPYACMGFQVRLELTLRDKGAGTLVALVRSFARMDAQVRFQVAQLIELLHAQPYRADEDFDYVPWVLNPFYVG